MYRKFTRHFGAATQPHASGGSRPSLARSLRPQHAAAARHSTAKRGLDMLRRMGKAEAVRVPWGAGLGKGDSGPQVDVIEQRWSGADEEAPR
jgi:hypothetical protein